MNYELIALFSDVDDWVIHYSIILEDISSELYEAEGFFCLR